MSIGYGPTIGPQNLNAMLGTAAVGRRDSARKAYDLWSVISNLGADEAAQVAALEAMSGWNNATTDPQAFWTAANQLYAEAQVYYGEIAQPVPFDTDNALAPARAGQ